MSDQGNETEARFSHPLPAQPSDAEIEAALALANVLYETAWSQRPFDERLAILARLADLMGNNINDLARSHHRRNICPLSPSPRPGRLDARRLERVVQFVEANLAMRITTESGLTSRRNSGHSYSIEPCRFPMPSRS